MRIVIIFLSFIMLTLAANIIAYSLSEDYRFFLKKMKYSGEIVTDSKIIDDSEKYELITEISDDGTVVVQAEEIDPDVFFLDVLKWTSDDKEQDEEDDTELPELFRAEQRVLDDFRESFILTPVNIPWNSLFWITDEFPDTYREYTNSHFSLYMFPSKSYKEVLKIFEVLRFELPIELNKVDNFGSASFYINMKEGHEDDSIRIVFEYENLAFWLKIKKDSYNSAKEILESF